DNEFSGKIYSSLIRSALDSLDTVYHKSTSLLIQSILKIDWLKHSDNEEFLKTYSRFLSVLVSGFPKWWTDVADKLIADFTKKRDTDLLIHHSTIEYIIQIIPTSTNSFPSILKKNYPNKNAPKKELVNYISNLLKLLTYCNELRNLIWSLIVENCIKLDVELQDELDNIDDDDIDEALQSNEEDDADLDDDDDDDDDEDSEDSDDEEEYNVEIQSISELSSKLDNIMLLLFEHVQKSISSQDPSLFNTLSSLFKSHILPTHQTRCIQYLLFHISQQDIELSESFLVMLVFVVFDSNEISSNRIKAMQYVASFIARAKILTRQQLLMILEYLTSWCNRFVNEREKEIGNGEGGMERFKIFYCVFQGLLYMFCFRYKELKNDRDEWELNLEKFYSNMILSGFNPLKYCNETVVLIFARLAQQVDLCYCFSIIERNKRERLNGIKGVKNGGKFESKQEFLDLEAYFPFDPLMLKKSKKVVNENYIEWKSIDDDSDSE
ncbi:hypothetical protein CANARDRAFT_187929, partial [[Candida] arabinofermentans NRRL YB-2248]